MLSVNRKMGTPTKTSLYSSKLESNVEQFVWFWTVLQRISSLAEDQWPCRKSVALEKISSLAKNQSNSKRSVTFEGVGSSCDTFSHAKFKICRIKATSIIPNLLLQFTSKTSYQNFTARRSIFGTAATLNLIESVALYQFQNLVKLVHSFRRTTEEERPFAYRGKIP